MLNPAVLFRIMLVVRDGNNRTALGRIAGIVNSLKSYRVDSTVGVAGAPSA
jgi:hypothetical protein